MTIKKPQFFLLTFIILALTFKVQANVFDEEDQNTIDQNSLNQLSNELQEMGENKSLSQIYLPASSSPTILPEPNKNEWAEETKIAEESADSNDENSDEVKRKEAAIMRDLDEHAKPLDDSPLTAAPSNEEGKIEQETMPDKPAEPPKEILEFKPRVRQR